MKKNAVSWHLAFPLILLILLISACQTIDKTRSDLPASKDQSLTIMSYNIRLGLGQEDPKGDIYRMPWGRNLDAVIAAIRAGNADIIGLQEVAGVPQARKIADALNMNFVFEWHQTSSSRLPWWGVAILSPHPIISSRGAQISTGRGNTRHIILANITSPNGQVTVVNIHKDKDLKDGLSFENILKEIEAEKDPVLLIGDLNVKPNDPRLASFLKEFTDTAKAAPTKTAREAEARGTFVRSKQRRIDYVFSETSKFHVLDAFLLAKEYQSASDHIAYVVKVKLIK